MTMRLSSWRLLGPLRSCLTSEKCMYTFFLSRFLMNRRDRDNDVVCLVQRGTLLPVIWNVYLHITDSERSVDRNRLRRRIFRAVLWKQTT